MTITPPAAAELQARYPEFAGVGTGLIDLIIADAAAYVDTTWRTVDQIPAILALAAHMLAVEGKGTGGGSAVSGPVSSVKVGDVSTTFAGVASGGAASMDGFGSTSYGLAFLRLRRRNFPAVAVA
jgi:hypothetical protein